MPEKTLVIGGKPVAFRATGATPRHYRMKFRRDIMKDMVSLRKSYLEAFSGSDNDDDRTESFLSVADLEIFENIAFIMAKQADGSIPDDPSQWLDGFNVFSIYEVLPSIFELWAENMECQVESKKNFHGVAAEN